MAQCAHRRPDGGSRWELQKRLNGYSIYRCTLCGQTRVV